MFQNGLSTKSNKRKELRIAKQCRGIALTQRWPTNYPKKLKVALLHPLLRRSAALAYTRRWWSILAMGAQTAAIDCILGKAPQVWVPQSAPPLASVLAWADIAPEPLRVV